MHRYTTPSVLLIALLAGAPRLAVSQVQPALKPIGDPVPFMGRSTGISLGHVVVPGNDVRITLIGFQTAMLQERGASTEFALYTSPEAAMEGALALVPKISLMSASRRGETWITLKVGANVPILLSPGGGGGGIFGVHAGLGAFLPASPKTMLRVEIEPHFYSGLQIYPPILLLSLGLTSRPASRQ